MIRLAAVIGLVLSLLIVPGCGTNMRKVHEAPLIDNKVLQQRVEAALHRAGPNFANVHVQTDSGTVLLTGTVPSADARAQADHVSRGVYGVKETNNELTLTKPTSAP